MTRSTPLTELSRPNSSSTSVSSTNIQQSRSPPPPPPQKVNQNSKPSVSFFDENDAEIMDKEDEFDIEKIINERNQENIENIGFVERNTTSSNGIKSLQDQIEFLKNEIIDAKRSNIDHTVDDSVKTSGVINKDNMESILGYLKKFDWKMYGLIFLLNLIVYSNQVNEILIEKLEDTRFIDYIFVLKALLSVVFLIIISKIV